MVAVRSEPARREACGRAASDLRVVTEAPRPAAVPRRRARQASTRHAVSMGVPAAARESGTRAVASQQWAGGCRPGTWRRAPARHRAGPGPALGGVPEQSGAGRARLRPLPVPRIRPVKAEAAWGAARRGGAARAFCGPWPPTAARARTGRSAGVTEKALAPARRPRSAMLGTTRIPAYRACVRGSAPHRQKLCPDKNCVSPWRSLRRRRATAGCIGVCGWRPRRSARCCCCHPLR